MTWLLGEQIDFKSRPVEHFERAGHVEHVDLIVDRNANDHRCAPPPKVSQFGFSNPQGGRPTPLAEVHMNFSHCNFYQTVSGKNYPRPN